MFRILMDTAGDMPLEWGKEYDIQIIPINIHFGEKTFLQGIDLSNKDFYRLVEESRIIPKTSQPTPQQFIEMYKKIAQPGDTILSVHVTGKLSGTMASAEMAARELEGQYNVIPFDSLAGSVAQGYMCREARIMEREGQLLEKILSRLDFMRKNISIILTLNTLEYAKMSGRVKALQAALASVLNVKPIITLREGVLELGEKVRTRSKSLEFVLNATKEKFGDRLVNAGVVHAEDPQAGAFLLEQVRARMNCKDLVMTELSIGVAANLGPGTTGIVAYPVEGG